MPSDAASPRAVLGEPLDELERLATGALEWMAAEREDTGREIRPGEVVHRIACRELHAACTPERIAQLVALARQAEECWCGVYRCIHNDADAGHRFSTEHPTEDSR